jgi:hypothetical protein
MATRFCPKLTEGALARQLERQLREARLEGAPRASPLGPKRVWRVWVALERAPARNGSDRLGVHGREAPPPCARHAEKPQPSTDLALGVRRRRAHRSSERESHAATRRQGRRQTRQQGAVVQVLPPAGEPPHAPFVSALPNPGVRSCRVLNGRSGRLAPSAVAGAAKLPRSRR